MDLYSQLVKFALLYALPLLFISVTYYQIVRVLWRSARMVVLNHPPTNNRSNSAGASAPSGDDPTTTAGSGNASRNHDNNSTSGLFLYFSHQSWQDSLFFVMDGQKIVGYVFLCYVIASSEGIFTAAVFFFFHWKTGLHAVLGRVNRSVFKLAIKSILVDNNRELLLPHFEC